MGARPGADCGGPAPGRDGGGMRRRMRHVPGRPRRQQGSVGGDVGARCPGRRAVQPRAPGVGRPSEVVRGGDGGRLPPRTGSVAAAARPFGPLPSPGHRTGRTTAVPARRRGGSRPARPAGPWTPARRTGNLITGWRPGPPSGIRPPPVPPPAPHRAVAAHERPPDRTRGCVTDVRTAVNLARRRALLSRPPPTRRPHRAGGVGSPGWPTTPVAGHPGSLRTRVRTRGTGRTRPGPAP